MPAYGDANADVFLENCLRPKSAYNPAFGKLYRVLHKGENLDVGIHARNPEGDLTPIQHIGMTDFLLQCQLYTLHPKRIWWTKIISKKYFPDGQGLHNSPYVSFTTDSRITAEWSTKRQENDELKENENGVLVEARRVLEVSRTYIFDLGCEIVDFTRTDIREKLWNDYDPVAAKIKEDSQNSCEVLVKCPPNKNIMIGDQAKIRDPKKENIHRTHETKIDDSIEYEAEPVTGHHKAKSQVN